MQTNAGTVTETTKSSRDLLQMPSAYAEPHSDLERKLCDAFSEVLKVDSVGRDDDFYDLGGDSLAGETLSLAIEQATGAAFPISNLYRFGTPAAIAEMSGGSRAPATGARFFIVHGRGGYTSLRPEFRNGLAPGREVTMFELPGLRGERRPIWSSRNLAATYVKQLEAEQPTGSIRLAAFCDGSYIGLVMAELLRKRGRALDRIVLIDPPVIPEVKARHLAELALEKVPRSISPREYYRQTLHWRGNPLIDRLVVWYGQPRVAKEQLRKIERRQKKIVSVYKQRGFQNWPRAVLLSMYRYIWPAPFTGKAYILASKQRLPDFEAPDSVWTRFTPNKTVIVLSEEHEGIGSGRTGATFAAELERILGSTPA